MLILILKIPQLGAVAVGDALEWAFFIILPNYCFGISLQNIYINYENKQSCQPVEDNVPDLETWCRLNDNRTGSGNPCCPSMFLFGFQQTELTNNQREREREWMNAWMGERQEANESIPSMLSWFEFLSLQHKKIYTKPWRQGSRKREREREWTGTWNKKLANWFPWKIPMHSSLGSSGMQNGLRKQRCENKSCLFIATSTNASEKVGDQTWRSLIPLWVFFRALLWRFLCSLHWLHGLWVPRDRSLHFLPGYAGHCVSVHSLPDGIRRHQDLLAEGDGERKIRAKWSHHNRYPGDIQDLTEDSVHWRRLGRRGGKRTHHGDVSGGFARGGELPNPVRNPEVLREFSGRG